MHLAELPDLQQVKLNSTKVTAAGLKHLRKCPLISLMAESCAGLTDDAVPVLAAMGKLTSLDIRGTGVTAAGVKKLAAALPKCYIDHDGATMKSK